VGITLIFILLYSSVFAMSALAESLKVTLLLGDTHSGTTVAAIKTIKKELAGRPALTIPDRNYDDISFYAYPTQDIRRQDLKHLRESQLVIIRVGDRGLVEALQPALAEVIKKGGKVYSVGGGYNSDHRKLGILVDEKISAYYRTRVVVNIKNMILYALNKDFALPLPYEAPVDLPAVGIYEHVTGKVCADFEFFRKTRGQRPAAPEDEKKPWVGVLFYRASVESGQMKPINAVIENLERQGFNVLAVYGHPTEAPLRQLLLSPEAPRIRLLVAIGAKMGQNAEVILPLLNKLNIPVINAVFLSTRSEEQWRQSTVGLDVLERGWQVSGPEMIGIIQPTVIAAKEKTVDKETGFEYREYLPIPERISSLTARVKAWINLQDKPNKDKKVALIYYNYPPGKHNIGAAYLNVLPQSLYEMANRMRAEGYLVDGLGFGREDMEDVKGNLLRDVNAYARNIGNWAPGELNRMVAGGNTILIPLETYKGWFNSLPEGFRKSVLKSWGPVEQSKIMIWESQRGEKFVVLPVLRYGNILFTPQPSRGWEQDENKLYHDVLMPPHHQYVAFYLWLKKKFRADAVVHVGTHGTHEWLPGKEIGFTAADPPEVLIGDLPNIYPYNVDNIAEGIQAKRRGMAVIIDHMTPPFDKAGLNRELKELVSLLNDYRLARDKSPALAVAKLESINTLVKKTGILKDLGIPSIADGDIENLNDYITSIAEKQTPFGLHTFGRSPEEKYRQSTAEAILAIEKGLSGEERTKRRADLEKRLLDSGPRELDSFMAALGGRYVPAGLGEDPIRNPDSLPTGKNFNSFDPSRVPQPATYDQGAKLAKELIEGYRRRHGAYPDKMTFNLWAEETTRNEGVMESQILYLLGVRPRWNERGSVTGVEIITRTELGRRRIDVNMVPSGLYRDVYSNLLILLDEGVSLAKNQQEEDNLLRANVLKTKKMLMDKGIAADKAERLAAVRIFTVPSGAYGTNLANVIPKSNTWEKENQVADVYFTRMSHLFGQGFWGAKEEQGGEDISRTVLKSALSGSKIAVHSRSSNLYETLDNNDFFQFLGGTALAIRSLDGKTPEVYVTNLVNPRLPKQETLERVMGREMRSRYLSPAWIKSMMKEGYGGARFIDKVVEHLWGWQVTVPEAVEAAKWNEMYETYVLDRNGINIKEMFRQAKNMHAYQALVARMLETVRKDYWQPDRQVMETLAKEYAQSVQEVGLACCDHTCNNLQLTSFTSDIMLSVPGLKDMASNFRKALADVKEPTREAVRKDLGNQETDKVRNPKPVSLDHASDREEKAPDGKGKNVAGYEMRETGGPAAASAPIPYMFMLGFLVFIGLISVGFRRRK